MTDIVERLADAALGEEFFGFDELRAAPMLTEAAAEITRLRAEATEFERVRDECDAENARFSAEILRLRAEAEALRKDAERYRWLKERNVTAVLLIAYSERAACGHDDPDTAVDAAIDATKGTT